MLTALAAAEVIGRLDTVRSSAPLVQCLTNAVVMNFTANALLALGASPAMVDLPDEAGQFAGIASAVLVNLGTPHADQRLAMRVAVASARAAGTPWVLDPVAIGSLPVRTALAHELVALSPTAVRGNPSEIIALAGLGGGGRGVDSVDGPERALDAAITVARRHGSVVAVSGATDIVTDGNAVHRLSNGSPWLTRVTGGGCALGAVMAAFLGSAGDDALGAVASATAVYTTAAERAAVRADGPGTFAVLFMDALAALSADDIANGMRAA